MKALRAILLTLAAPIRIEGRTRDKGLKPLAFPGSPIAALILLEFLSCAWAFGCGLALAADPADQPAPPATPLLRDPQFQENLKRWLDLTPQQQEKLRELHDRWLNATPEQRADWRAKVRRFRQMPDSEKEQIRRRWHDSFQLTPEQRQKLQRFREEWQSIPPQRRRWLIHSLRQLSPEKRQELLQELRKLRDLPPDQRREQARELLKRYLGTGPAASSEGFRLPLKLGGATPF